MGKPNEQLLEDFRQEFVHKRITAACLCGSERYVKYMMRDRYGIPIMPVFCLDCGHVYARYRLNKLDTEAFYATTYRTLYSGESGLKSAESAKPRISTARKVILPAFRSLVQHKSNPIVVEWGCGAGWNLVPFKEAGVQVYGFDFDSEYVDFGSSHFDLPLQAITPGSDAVPAALAEADFVILNHVLEHVSDPIALLHRLSSSMKPAAYIYVGLPFLENLGIWRLDHFFHIAHLHYFSLPYWKRLVVFHGYRVISEHKRHGYVVLQRSSQNAADAPTCRVYNAQLLARYAVFYRVIYPLWRAFVELCKRVPGLEKSYSFAMQRFRSAGTIDE